MIEVVWKMPNTIHSIKRKEKKKRVKTWKIPREDSAAEVWEKYREAMKDKMKQWMMRWRLMTLVDRRKSVNQLWEEWWNIIVNAAENVIGEVEVIENKEKEWTLSREERKARKERKEAYDKWKEAKEKEKEIETWKKFVEERRKVAIIVRKRKREYREKVYDKIEKSNANDAWKAINMLRGKKTGRKLPERMEKKEGGVTLSDEEVVSEMMKHLKSLSQLNEKDQRFDEEEAKKVKEQMEEIDNGEQEVWPWEFEKYNDKKITNDEVKKAMRICTSGKAMGVDRIKNEFIKHGGECMVESLAMLMNVMWQQEFVPDQWLDATITPVFKSGARTQFGNYRGIALMSVVAKVYERVLTDRMTEWLEKRGLIVEEQGGFREGRGCIDQIYTLNEIVQSRREKKKPTYIAFMDFTKAYDIVWRDGLFQQLHNGIACERYVQEGTQLCDV